MDENTLYYGDNLDILKRYIKDETIDLVYLDPPFKSSQNYNIKMVTAGSVTPWCKTTFTVTPAGVVENWSWEGNACRSDCPLTLASIYTSFTEREYGPD